ncbi:hypothetical protein GOP47_0017903 [Adiantum capillus-veneris]|uniref:Uncharacterized protein n=1 Tax=Adiantum capillus-veneris TaxID=13818 RepID=A0A9D4ZBA2_ADICA|nr:hypothetical protein GOP47_0017903 [Adiantum capillus-veneris]
MGRSQLCSINPKIIKPQLICRRRKLLAAPFFTSPCSLERPLLVEWRVIRALHQRRRRFAAMAIFASFPSSRIPTAPPSRISFTVDIFLTR